MSSDTRWCRSLAVALLLAPALPARADERVVLERLGRIARGEWVAPASLRVSAARRVPFALQIRAAARRHALPASLLAALVRAESAFDPRAVSHKGALGLTQLMPATARELRVRDPFDPVENLDGGARYLAAQVASFGDLNLALAAYHAGPERASAGLRAVPAGTRTYVARVLRFEREYRGRGLP